MRRIKNGEAKMARLALVVSLSLVGATLFAQNADSFKPTAFAQLNYFEGTVRIDAVDAQIGQLVPYGSLLQCGDDSFAEVSMGAGNIMRIGENSVVVVQITPVSRRVELRTGSFAAVLNGLEALSRDSGAPGFFLKAHGTVAGVRGTSFFAAVESPESTYVCTCNGSLSFNDDSYTAFSTVYYHHGARRFLTAPDGTVTVEVAPLLYHTDADMEALAAKVGATIPWSDSY